MLRPKRLLYFTVSSEKGKLYSANSRTQIHIPHETTESSVSQDYNIWTYRLLRITLRGLKSVIPVLSWLYPLPSDCSLDISTWLFKCHFSIGIVLLVKTMFMWKVSFLWPLFYTDMKFLNFPQLFSSLYITYSQNIKPIDFSSKNVLTFIISSIVPLLGSKLDLMARQLHLPSVYFPQTLSLTSPTFPVLLLTSVPYTLFPGLSLSYLIQSFAGHQASPDSPDSHWLSQGAPFAPSGPVSCGLCSATFAVGQPPIIHAATMFLHPHGLHTCNILPGLLQIPPSSPNHIKACSSSLLCEDFPDYPLWTSHSNEPTIESIIICSFELFSDCSPYDGGVCSAILKVMWDRGLCVAYVCTDPHWHTLHGAQETSCLLSYHAAGTRPIGL